MSKVITLFFMCFFGFLSSQEINKEQLKKEIREELKAELKKQSNIVKKENSLGFLSNFQLKGYGVINYYNYDWDTDVDRRSVVDAERLNLYLNYSFTKSIALKTELEFEHGGTGVTMELDKLEEFGEYEQEIETGGEVKLEQVYIDFKIKPYFNIKTGRFKMYFGLAQNLDTPDEYFTAYRPEMQNELLPLGWYEVGLEAYGKLFNNKLLYRLAFVNGLDATGFSSRGFIKGGYQTRFEMANAENWATSLRLDYKIGKHKNSFIGITGYFGNSADNRPKPDVKTDAYVSLIEGHFTYNEKALRVNSMILYGNLQNSDIITRRNKNLSNALGVKRNAVSKNTLGFSVEAGYNVLSLIGSKTKQKLYPFAGYDFYDSMYKVHNIVTDNPRWNRSVITTGINWFVHKGVIFKIHYSSRKLGSKKLNTAGNITNDNEYENTFVAGIGFVF